MWVICLEVEILIKDKDMPFLDKYLFLIQDEFITELCFFQMIIDFKMSTGPPSTLPPTNCDILYAFIVGLGEGKV